MQEVPVMAATFQDNQENWWHVSTISIAVKNNFERRIGIWPAGFDKDDVMYMDAAFGDYPHYLPASAKNASAVIRVPEASRAGCF